MGRLCSRRYERIAYREGWLRVAGVDEVGRGSLFGPLFAAAVILSPKRRIHGIDDSKKLPPERREILAERIKEHALAWAFAEVAAAQIDAWNVYQATKQAMVEAIEQLQLPPDYLLLDGMGLEVATEQKVLIKGDNRSASIAAASILAKVARDARLREWDRIYPQYGLGRNKGYATPEHLQALRRYGPSPLHRLSFAPVRESVSWGARAEQTALGLAATGSCGTSSI
ncbi:MAG TPA: ribonuclease HII [Candidatus Acidoferrales bacterium]